MLTFGLAVPVIRRAPGGYASIVIDGICTLVAIDRTDAAIAVAAGDESAQQQTAGAACEIIIVETQ